MHGGDGDDAATMRMDVRMMEMKEGEDEDVKKMEMLDMRNAA